MKLTKSKFLYKVLSTLCVVGFVFGLCIGVLCLMFNNKQLGLIALLLIGIAAISIVGIAIIDIWK